MTTSDNGSAGGRREKPASDEKQAPGVQQPEGQVVPPRGRNARDDGTNQQGGLLAKLRVPDEKDFRSAAHSEKVTARIGVWLGITFGICFLTGVLSHFLQHGPAWFYWPSSPVNLYRVTQGLHVICGVAAIPLLLAKLWSVYPKLFGRPLVRSVPHALERVSILLLSGAAFFELATGIFNSAQNYVWGFAFPPAHYVVAWVAIGSVLLHVAVKWPAVRRGLGRLDPVSDKGLLSRRAFLRTTWLATGAAVVATAGSTVPVLRDVSPLSLRSARGPQGLPVNRTARAARVPRAGDSWRLTVVTPNRTTTFSLRELERLAQATEELPIACVEGWSQSAVWSGVRVDDLLRIAGAPPGSRVRVSSTDRGPYGASTLPGSHSGDPRTLLAMKLNGEVLALDHGYPCRLIAPNRPGVLQTKWVTRLEVL
ncbi:MAG TPA: molybdopterin-dependent oxidoreductase [Actinophytocola sp.]|uniref:molybdopterin-dependent oxidoreductase n=1 Tax=Actinophytocola sp. TaxID=1872138 RepID=UPI002F923E1C